MITNPDTLEFDVTISREMTTAIEGSQDVDGFLRRSSGGILDGLMPALIPAYVAPAAGRGGGFANKESGTNFFTCGMLPNSSGGAKPFLLGMREGESVFVPWGSVSYDFGGEEPMTLNCEGKVNISAPFNNGSPVSLVLTFVCLKDVPEDATVLWSLGINGQNGTGEGETCIITMPDPPFDDGTYGFGWSSPLIMTIRRGGSDDINEAMLIAISM